MKYKFFYSLSFFPLYGSTVFFLIALSRSSLTEATICLLSSLIFYKLTANWIYYAKDWIKASIISFSLLFGFIIFETPFLSYAIAISYLSATFIQVYLDEMCRSKEE